MEGKEVMRQESGGYSGVFVSGLHKWEQELTGRGYKNLEIRGFRSQVGLWKVREVREELSKEGSFIGRSGCHGEHSRRVGVS